MAFGVLAMGPTGAASARARSTPADPLKGARIAMVSGSLEIKMNHCSPVLPEVGGECDDAVLKLGFTPQVDPAAKPAAGLSKFPRALDVTVVGTGHCETGEDQIPDPNAPPQQLLGSARVVPAHFGTTRVLVGSGRAGVRWAWLDPLVPPASCNGLAVPRRGPDALPRDLASPWLAPRELARRSFGASIAGSRQWITTNPDQSTNTYKANWSFQIRYVRT